MSLPARNPTFSNDELAAYYRREAKALTIRSLNTTDLSLARRWKLEAAAFRRRAEEIQQHT